MSLPEIRDAIPADADGIACIHVETWRSAYKGIVPDAHLTSLDMGERAQRWREIVTNAEELVLVAVGGSGEIVGWATGGRGKTGDAVYTGELNGIYVHPSAQGRGIGRLLVQTVAKRLAAEGHQSLLLWTLAANIPARRFYEALGGQRLADRHKQEDIGGIVLAEVAYGWADIGPFLESTRS